MKYICLDTETTGFFTKTDRVIEIGCVDITNGIHEKTVYQQYINPLRNVPEASQAIHGITTEFLKDFKTFEYYVDEFLNFIKDATLIIHNAAFDIRFLNSELARINLPELQNPVIDTLKLAKEKFPNKKVSLDALKSLFNINIEREKHGALLDAEILAHVYLEMQKNQTSLDLSNINNKKSQKKTLKSSEKKIGLSKNEIKENDRFFNNDK